MDDIENMSLKALVASAGLSSADCLDKSDLYTRAKEAAAERLAAAATAAPADAAAAAAAAAAPGSACKEIPVNVSWMKMCWGCGKAEEGEVKFQRCPNCIEAKLPNSYFCSTECFHANWKRHKVYHKEQKPMMASHKAAQQRTEAIESTNQIYADAVTNPKDTVAQQVARGALHMARNDLHKAEKAFRLAINAEPACTAAYHNLAVVLSRSNKRTEACTYAMRAADMALNHDGKSSDWAKSWGVACALLFKPSCATVPRPSWWTDVELLSMSEAVTKIIPDEAEVGMPYATWPLILRLVRILTVTLRLIPIAPSVHRLTFGRHAPSFCQAAPHVSQIQSFVRLRRSARRPSVFGAKRG